MKKKIVAEKDILVDVIALGSPSGKMSRRALDAAQKKLHAEMKEAGYFEGWEPKPNQPSRAEQLQNNIRNIEELLERGMKPKGYKKALAAWKQELEQIIIE